MASSPEQKRDPIDEELRELVEAEEDSGELKFAFSRRESSRPLDHLYQRQPQEEADTPQPQLPPQETPRRWSHW